MRRKEALASALHLLVLLFIFSLSAFLFLLPLRPDLRLTAMDWLAEEPQRFYWVGKIFCSIGFFFLLSFYALSRGRFTRLLMRSSSVSIEHKLLKKVVDEFFAAHFPQAKVEVSLLPKEELELAMSLPSLEEKERDAMLLKIEEQFSLLLRERFGYDKPFTLSLRHKNR